MGQPLGWALPLQGALRAPSPAHIKAQAWSWARRGRSVCQGPRGFHDHHIPSASCQELALADPLELLSVGEGWGQGRAGWPGADPAAQSKSPRPEVGTPPEKTMSRACLPGDWPGDPARCFLPSLGQHTVLPVARGQEHPASALGSHRYSHDQGSH